MTFESKPRWPGAPPICTATNLIAFDTEKDCAKFLSSLGDHMPMLARWQCKKCWKWHFWSTAPTDTNGGGLAGSTELPERIAAMIAETKIA